MSFIKKLSKFINKLNISDKDSNPVKINHENCYDPDNKKYWCKECVPRCIIEGWTSGNDDIDNLIKDSIYNVNRYDDDDDDDYDYDVYPIFLEWVPFDRFKDVKQIGEGGFAKVYSATWIDGIAKYTKQDDGNWIKKEPVSKQVALKRLNGSQNMSSDFLNELKTHWKLNCLQDTSLKFYGITKDPETEEIMMIMEYADDFGLSRLSNEQKSSDSNKIVGVLPYIAPEVLNGEPYTLSSDIYSFGVVMAELSSGKPPFYKRKHDGGLALEICNGLRPEFGKGTPEIYKKLAHRCMNANPNQRPIANELEEILNCWDNYKDNEKYGYKGKEVRNAFKEADKEIPNISTSYEKKPDAIYTSRAFTFSNLSKPINSSFIATTYLNEEDNEGCQDSQLVDLEVPNTSKLEEDNSDN
ncbi:unnamed protein product [Rhizophagus irregularis]|nr:unnamed protein product [Rhizophagus irregularis]